MFDCHQNDSNNHGNYYQVYPCNNGCNGNMNDANPGRQFEPYIGCSHCSMTQNGTMGGSNQPHHNVVGQTNQFQTLHKSGSNVKSNEATALSMTAQPYVPSYVMDIARPMPLTKSSASSRKNRDSVVTHDSGNYPGNAYHANQAQQQYAHQLPTQTLTPITCSCCCNNNNGNNIEQFLQKPMQQLSMNVPQQERGRQMNTNRFSQMIHPGILMDSNGGNSMNFVHQEISNPPVMRSRSSWRTSAQREMDNSSPILNQRQFMQPTHTPIFSTHCSCMSNNDSNNVMIFPDKTSQQSSFDLMNQTPGHRMSMNDQQSFCMSCNGGQTLKKASLPPASHHTPEQRTSYRQ